ncbi:hypothetical protein C0214_17000 [Methylobacterium sp. DM1]|nr:hypothetical protein C0214_17000 [Methylobacterium sp. DM1]
MRYHEFARPERPCRGDDPRASLSFYVVGGEYTDCLAMIRHHGGKVLGTTQVLATGGMTIQVKCTTADAAHDLFAAWLDLTKTISRRPR